MKKSTGILNVFMSKCGSLCRDSDGAALAITLAFMLPVCILFVGI